MIPGGANRPSLRVIAAYFSTNLKCNICWRCRYHHIVQSNILDSKALFSSPSCEKEQSVPYFYCYTIPYTYLFANLSQYPIRLKALEISWVKMKPAKKSTIVLGVFVFPKKSLLLLRLYWALIQEN